VPRQCSSLTVRELALVVCCPWPAHLSESERKKALNKLKKAQAKAQAAKEAEPKKEAVAKKGGKVDEDPDGQKLVQVLLANIDDELVLHRYLMTRGTATASLVLLSDDRPAGRGAQICAAMGNADTGQR